MPEERRKESAAQTDTLTSSEAQALEAQIATQTLTVKQAVCYFGNGYYGTTGLTTPPNYATVTQIRRLAHKTRMAVKGLNPWGDDSIFLGFHERKAEPLVLPEPGRCEFCGATLEHIGIMRHRQNSAYEWEVERWSSVPLRCECEQAKAKWDALEAEEQRRQEEERRQQEELSRRKRIETALAQSGMKKRFLARTFANFQTDTPGRTKAHRVAKEYADNFTAHMANGDGLYIEGTFGTGKTHLAAAIAIQLMEQGHNVIFKTADDLLRDIKATFDDTGQEEKKVIDRLKTCELLVIDDIGKEQATDWSTAQLYAIINDRYECQRPLIITTNFNENDLVAVESPKGVGEHRIRAILSRLHEACRLLTMSWPDWRGAQ